MKSKKIWFISLSLASISLALGPALALSSCTQNTKDITPSLIKIETHQPWSKSFSADKISFFKNVQAEYNRLKNLDPKAKNLPNIEIDFKPVGDNATIFNDVLTNKAQIGYATFEFLMQQNNIDASGNIIRNIDKVKTLLSTTTFMPKYDLQPWFWSTDSEKLNDMVAKMNTLFTQKPFKDWNNTDYGWKNGIYTHFYQNGKNVSWYRGMIFIAGDDNTLAEIKKAWNAKDWNSFKNFGIVLSGSRNSSSKYIYPEFLFKKHFNLAGNSFSSFANERSKDQIHFHSYLPSESAKDMGIGQNANFHIFLGEEAEYGYHNNASATGLFTRPEGQKIEILTVTDPIKFDTIIASKNLDENVLKLLKQAFLNVSEAKKDDFSYFIGVSGYEDALGKENDFKNFFLKASN